jgi:hypothetical protein
VGARQFNTFGSHGSADYVNYRHFPTLQECCRYLKEDRGKQPEKYLFSSSQLFINSASMHGYFIERPILVTVRNGELKTA